MKKTVHVVRPPHISTFSSPLVRFGSDGQGTGWFWAYVLPPAGFHLAVLSLYTSLFLQMMIAGPCRQGVERGSGGHFPLYFTSFRFQSEAKQSRVGKTLLEIKNITCTQCSVNQEGGHWLARRLAGNFDRI